MAAPENPSGSAAAHPDAEGTQDILMVCTANICRSPLAEHMLRALFAWEFRNGRATGPHRTVGSAGTLAQPGIPIHELSRVALAKRMVPVGDTLSRPVTDKLISEAGLVLTSTRQQRARVVEQSPSDVKHVFAMRDFARLVMAGRRVVPDAKDNSTPTLLMLASAGRSLLQPVPEELGDIPDPVTGGPDEFEACAEMICGCLLDIFHPHPEFRPTLTPGRTV
ncbi:MAG: hypothetical protein WBF71_12615 [Microthrixaceae bacterium]|jgi:protein-tyrosine phosphatase